MRTFTQTASFTISLLILAFAGAGCLADGPDDTDEHPEGSADELPTVAPTFWGVRPCVPGYPASYPGCGGLTNCGPVWSGSGQPWQGAYGGYPAWPGAYGGHAGWPGSYGGYPSWPGQSPGYYGSPNYGPGGCGI